MSSGSAAARRWRGWLPAIAVMVVIFVLSSQSGLRVSEDANVDRPLRIGAHLLAFGTLAGLLLYALVQGRQPRPRGVALALVLTFLYAVLDELHQSLVPDRTGRAEDVVTDMVGGLIGVAVATIVLTARASRSRPGVRQTTPDG